MAYKRVSLQKGEHPSLNFTLVKLEWPLPSLNFTLPTQLGMTTSFSKFYPCLAHKRVSQVEMATSFSKFYPRVAHQRVSQLGMTTSFSKFTPALPTKG